MKHFRTLAAVCNKLHKLGLAWMIYDFCYGFSPLRHHGLFTAWIAVSILGEIFNWVAHGINDGTRAAKQ